MDSLSEFRSTIEPSPDIPNKGSIAVTGDNRLFQSMGQVWGCHDLGVCDKVVLDLVLSSFHNGSLLGLLEISLIHMIHRRHGLVADSKTSKTVVPIP